MEAQSKAGWIVKAEAIPVRVPRRTAFQVAYATRTAWEGILLRLETDEGRVGWGEAVAVAEVTGERRAEVYRALREWAAARLVGRNPFEQEALRTLAEEELAAFPSARAAVDMALWDLRGQVLGRSVRELLGGARRSLPATMSIGIKGREETTAEVGELLARGFRSIKVKIGLDPDEDLGRVLELRRRFGHGWQLLLDANQGYTVDQAVALVEALDKAGAGVELIEQPVKAEDLAGLAEVTRRSPIPIVADEAVKDAASLLEVIHLRSAHMVNIKLMKCGGPTNAALLVRLAEAAGMKAMIGCMIESRVGITAGLSVALGLGNVHYIDLDGYFDLADDIVRPDGGAQPTSAGIRSESDPQAKGPSPGLHPDEGRPDEGGQPPISVIPAGVTEPVRQYLAEGPGLGLSVDEAKLARYIDRSLAAGYPPPGEEATGETSPVLPPRGYIIVPVACLHREPSEDSEVVTQARMGETFQILDLLDPAGKTAPADPADDGVPTNARRWWRVRLEYDGYEGFLLPSCGRQFNRSELSPAAADRWLDSAPLAPPAVSSPAAGSLTPSVPFSSSFRATPESSTRAAGVPSDSPGSRIYTVKQLFANVYARPSIKSRLLVTLPLGVPVRAEKVVSEDKAEPTTTGTDLTGEPADRPPGVRPEWVAVELPGGLAGFMQARDLTPGRDEWSWQTPAQLRASLVRTARRFLRLPYRWGGTSSFGLDCSGFVQLLYRLHGLFLPRDAHQQADYLRQRSGAAPFGLHPSWPVRRADLLPGDLIFFNDYGHVGMAISHFEFIHATTQGEPVVQLSEVDDPYWQSRRTAIGRYPIPTGPDR
ncbi:MAG TPA: hypothetical protein GXX55_00025 [Firmicutes bacterium]|nr:hypothetical protein [Bacillota bacterium]